MNDYDSNQEDSLDIAGAWSGAADQYQEDMMEELQRLRHFHSRVDHFERTLAHEQPERFIAAVISELFAFDEFPHYGKAQTEGK